MKKSKLLKVLLIGIALIFLLQAFSTIVIIPIKPVISFLGQTEDPLKLFFSGMMAIISVFIGSAIIEVLYSLGFRKESGFISQKRVFVQGIIAFITIWLTFFTYGILSAFGVIPKIVESARLFNVYLFWFLFINSFVKISVKNPAPSFEQSSSDILEKNRITWLSHITGLNRADEFQGEKGEIVYKQTKSSNIGYIVILIIIGLFFQPMLFITGGVAFLDIPINPPEAAFFIKFIFGFFFFMASLGILYMLGLALSRGIVLYKNSIELPLATISDTPVFTLLLPRSCVVLAFDDIVSYELEKRKNRKSDHYYLSLIKLNMRSGDVVITKPTMFNPDNFEKVFIATLGEEKKIG
ncbi:MAG: hypothetical protein FJY98_03490 [Candidatus Liptonbacteria bacterium]|nr:hypothetical protein [Candidatus Liptonbacteria bacterium]